jgi:hypothetical protein
MIAINRPIGEWSQFRVRMQCTYGRRRITCSSKAFEVVEELLGFAFANDHEGRLLGEPSGLGGIAQASPAYVIAPVGDALQQAVTR